MSVEDDEEPVRVIVWVVVVLAIIFTVFVIWTSVKN